MMMPDAVNVNDLPVGYPAYLGYTDGDFVTATALEGLFPDAELVLLTVNGSTPGAHGARLVPGEDVEPGNLNAAMARVWVQNKLKAEPLSRPVIYASVQGRPNFGMGNIIAALHRNGIRRDQVRLLAAHWTDSPHVCGPHSCGAIDTDMDGTQWTSSYRTQAGALIDMSMLRDDFFALPTPPPTPNWTEKIVKELPIVRQGDTGPAVRTVQALCNARNLDLDPDAFEGGGLIRVDGEFGANTLMAVKHLQSVGAVTIDGIVGPATWPVLLGIA